MKLNEELRTIELLFETPELKNLKCKFLNNGNVTLALPVNEMNKWMWQIFVRAFNSFEHIHNDAPLLNTPELYNNDDNYIKGHKKLVRFMRRLYNKFPLVFGYSVRNPLDEKDIEFGDRVALERLIINIQDNKQHNKQQKDYVMSGIHVTFK